MQFKTSFARRKNGLMSMLLLVFIIGFVVFVILLALLSGAYGSIKRANNQEYGTKAFYAAEGAVYETIEHLKQGYSWIEVDPYKTNYNIGGAEIERTIDYKSDTNSWDIDVTASVKGIKKRVKANVSFSGEVPEVGNAGQTIDWEDIVYSPTGTITVQPGYSYIERFRNANFKWDYRTVENTGPDPLTVTKKCDNCYLYSCVQTECPTDFEMYCEHGCANDEILNVSNKVEAGTMIQIGNTAILDYNGNEPIYIKSGTNILFTCPLDYSENYVSPPCVYTFTSDETNVYVEFVESIAIDNYTLQVPVVTQSITSFQLEEAVPGE